MQEQPMNLLPYRKITIATKLTKQEVLQKISENSAKADILNPYGSTLFSGTVNPEGFKIRRNINYKNSFIPFITGRFLSHENRTTLELIFKPLEFFIAFMILWLGGVTLGCIFTLYTALTSTEDFSAPMLIPFVMFVFGIVLFKGAFAFEYPKSKAALLNLINAEEIDT
jgi:hypothetical protein